MADTLACWRRAKFEWGKTDCILSTCDHVLRVTGIDPAAPWRGSYHDREGAEGIYLAYGGVLGLARSAMTMAGFSESTAEAGSPVVARFGDVDVAGVCTGRHVAFMMEGRGCIEIPTRVLEVKAAWYI